MSNTANSSEKQLAPHKSRGQRLQESRTIRSFREIMQQVDQNGDYNQVALLEFREKINLRKLHQADRNFIKNQVVALMRFTGMSPAEVAHHFGISANTVNTWRAKVAPEILAEIERAELNLVKNRVAQVLTTTLGAMERIALHASEREYIQKQSPDEIVKLYDSLAGFSMRLIEAKQRADIAAAELHRPAQQEPRNVSKIDVVPAVP